MAGTIGGGKSAARTNKKRYGEDFYAKIGAIGGKTSGLKGFAGMDPQKRSEAGRKGGMRSKRGPNVHRIADYV